MQGTPPNCPPEADIKEGLDTSNLIETIPQPVRLSAPKDVPIENVRYLASYNWVDTEKPTIVVPGSPGVFTGRDVPFTLQPDTGSNFIDQNAGHLSDYPMLPLFTAVDVMYGNEAPVDWPSVDVITDRNGLRKLLRWLSPSAGREVCDFRIDVELIGTKTIVLGRWEGWARNPPSMRSFGFGFEAAMTSPYPGCPGSGHHRAISYDMHDLKMIVRFEVDACSSSTNAGTATATQPEISDMKNYEKNKPSQSVADLADALESINLASAASAPTKTSARSSEPIINVIRAGTQVPQDALLELTSRSKYYVDQLDWNELYPQLVLSQTPTLHLGIHERGTFTELREWRVDGAGADGDTGAPADFAAQRRRTAEHVVRLARVLEDVQELAISRGPGPAGSFSLVCERGQLRVYACKGAKSCLLPDVKERFAGA
ncbi:hypothetical protein F5148DRAFT_987853 [Russula earlei]|uniref:Uncharacterized protein n=1 Tax=Russula earlei TaxID=71964 RepID=A0ACC0TTV1_9AGAM|nr:hypothetical protein F5148DRAFT_987853 [Russula earlei]